MKKHILFVLLVLGLMTAPALAGGPVNVLNELGFGALVDSKFSESTGASGFKLSVDTRVFLQGDTYTYVYEINDKGTTPFGISIAGVTSQAFDGNLNWGTVGGPAFLGVATFTGDLTFRFSPNLPSGTTTTIYAQSTQGPLDALFGASGGFGFFGSTDSLGPGADAPLANAPEPGTLLLLGAGLLGGGGFLRKKLGR